MDPAFNEDAMIENNDCSAPMITCLRRAPDASIQFTGSIPHAEVLLLAILTQHVLITDVCCSVSDIHTLAKFSTFQ